MHILMSWLKIILVVQILFSFVFGRGYVVGDKVAWWLAHWTPDREVRVRALGRSLCCVLGQDTLLSQCLSLPRSKWVPANCQGNLKKYREVTCDGLASHPGGVAIFIILIVPGGGGGGGYTGILVTGMCE